MMGKRSSVKQGVGLMTQPQATEINAIRIESVLSRLPLHSLAKHGGKGEIKIVEKDVFGKVQLRWEVIPNKTFGEPGPLAYKLDTLVVNRAIDQAARPVPSVLALGSMRDICRQLGCAEDTRPVRRALRQNASAWIIVKLAYKDVHGQEQTLEAEFARYSIIFTGEKLPTGEQADQVYLSLADVYQRLLNSAPRRPLDYDYMKHLTPAAHRFYEIFSYNIFAALNSGAREPVAQMRYSRYCTLSGQKRSFKWDNVRPQMADVFKPHLKSGYLETAKLVPATNDAEGNPDWVISATPGTKARIEFAAFNQKHGPRIQLDKNEERLFPEATRAKDEESGPEELVEYFHRVAHGVSGYKAVRGGKEIKLAEEVLEQFGPAAGRYLVDYAVRESARTDFTMVTFGAVRQYIARAMALYEALGTAGDGAKSKAPEAELESELQHLRAYEEALARAERLLSELPEKELEELRAEAKEDIREYARSRKLSIDDSSLAEIVRTRMKRKVVSKLLGPEAPSLFDL